MRRAAFERARTVRVWRAHLLTVHPDGVNGCACELQPGRFRKGQRVAGCGLVRCFVCKGSKLLGRPTLQEERSDISFNEWLREFGFPARSRRGSGW